MAGRDAARPAGRGGVGRAVRGCTACCTSSQFVHIGPDEVDTLAHIPDSCCSRRPGCPSATCSWATTSTAGARCSSTAGARSTSTGRGRAARTTAGCSPPPASRPTTTSRHRPAGPAVALRPPTTAIGWSTRRCGGGLVRGRAGRSRRHRHPTRRPRRRTPHRLRRATTPVPTAPSSSIPTRRRSGQP